MKNNMSPEYFSVNLNSLKTDSKIGCDLYLLAETGADSRYVLYCREDSVFENDKRDQLLEMNIQRLFIEKDDQKKYYEYLENNIHDIISDTKVSHDEKTYILQSTGLNLVKDLFNDPQW